MVRDGRPARSRRRRDHGAAAVEFALVVPMLLLLVYGIVDFSRAYNTQITLTESAAEGARALAIGRNDADATAAARAVLVGSAVTPADARVTITGRCTTASSTQPGAMQVTIGFQLLTPVPAPTSARQFDLQGVGARACAS